MKKYFVTGTDTEVGKTFVASSMLNLLSRQGERCFGLKPIASGCEKIVGKWMNEDALSLIENSSISLPYEDVNPIALPEAIAPHLAAKKNNIDLSVNDISNHCRKIFKQNEAAADYSLVEGAGGWFVPLNDEETYADVIKVLNLDVILVIGIRLGCINHALLTESAIQQSGLKLTGWVANTVSVDVPNQKEIVQTLKQKINAPCMGVIPYLAGNKYSENILMASDFLRTPE
ncbi:MAG: dethiobiotin synthase [Cellvibrionaceae bacterium]